MSSSRAPAAVNALLSVLKAAPALAGVPVFDGPVATDDYSDALFIGYDGDTHGERESVITDQQWAGLGAKKRTETITIICSAVAVSGDGTALDARTRVYNLMASVENTLRTDPSMAQTPTPFIAAVTAPRLLYDWLEMTGLQARLTFSVHIETRI